MDGIGRILLFVAIPFLAILIAYLGMRLVRKTKSGFLKFLGIVMIIAGLTGVVYAYSLPNF